MSDENGNIESHTLVLLREIRDRLDRIEERKRSTALAGAAKRRRHSTVRF